MIKRINPKTGKPFKSGDARADGMVFRSYQLTRKLPSDPQYFYENWYTKEEFGVLETKGSQQASKYIKEKRRITKETGNRGTRRINPNTDQQYRSGDLNEDQTMTFQAYDDWIVDDLGYSLVRWMSPQTYKRRKKRATQAASKARKDDPVNFALGKARRRALGKNVPFNLTVSYLKDIYPANNLCPVFDILLEWGGGSDETSRNNSPSLDRIIPELGYVEGNVVWISNRANILKRDASWEELQKVASWLKSITPK